MLGDRSFGKSEVLFDKVCQEFGMLPAILSATYVNQDGRYWEFENRRTTNLLKHVLGLIPTLDWKQNSVNQGMALFDTIYSELKGGS